MPIFGSSESEWLSTLMQYSLLIMTVLGSSGCELLECCNCDCSLLIMPVLGSPGSEWLLCIAAILAC